MPKTPGCYTISEKCVDSIVKRVKNELGALPQAHAVNNSAYPYASAYVINAKTGKRLPTSATTGKKSSTSGTTTLSMYGTTGKRSNGSSSTSKSASSKSARSGRSAVSNRTGRSTAKVWGNAIMGLGKYARNSLSKVPVFGYKTDKVVALNASKQNWVPTGQVYTRPRTFTNVRSAASTYKKQKADATAKRLKDMRDARNAFIAKRADIHRTAASTRLHKRATKADANALERARRNGNSTALTVRSANRSKSSKSRSS